LGHLTPTYTANFVNNVGFLYTNLDLMGDRITESGSAALTGRDSLYGSGRFRARAFESAYMDDPFGFEAYQLTISTTGTTSINVNGGVALPSQVDRLVAVLWWPESDLVAGPDIVLEVSSCTGTFPRADLSFDNRKRVYLSSFDTAGGGVGARCWRVNLSAFSVPSPRTVWVGLYYEDLARDDLWSAYQ